MKRKLDALYPVQRRDVLQAAAVLVDAFEHDPIWQVVLSDTTPTQKVGAFETPLLYCLKYGEVYAPSERLEGIAVWAPGKWAAMMPWRVLLSGAMCSRAFIYETFSSGLLNSGETRGKFEWPSLLPPSA